MKVFNIYVFCYIYVSESHGSFWMKIHIMHIVVQTNSYIQTLKKEYQRKIINAKRIVKKKFNYYFVDHA